ncbi:MAG: HAMP domain-containing histidine kinase [Planctomycetaceae bacterium]|jgi:signal transduction histidine kinase|nr:HAMP domain-containing histidine kinase [Planctomycetaceae bacterium]
MKTTKSKKPPLKSQPQKKQITTSKTKTINIANQIVVDNAVDNFSNNDVVNDDFFWSEILSGNKSVVELRSLFDTEVERRKLEALAEFAAGAGHEINNPLAIISGTAQLLIREITNPEHQHKLAAIIAQVKRAYEMIADVRFFARPPLPEISKFDLVKEIEKIIDEQKIKLLNTDQEKYVEIIFETKIKSLLVETDQTQLHVAITAICNNAREALAAKNIGRKDKKCDGYINISLRKYKGEGEGGGKVGGGVEIAVEDNGIGIAPEVKRLIFCPYFSGRQAGRGLGFGLPKTWRIIQSLKGTIKTETTKKQNTKFIINIPNKYSTE